MKPEQPDLCILSKSYQGASGYFFLTCLETIFFINPLDYLSKSLFCSSKSHPSFPFWKCMLYLSFHLLVLFILCSSTIHREQFHGLPCRAFWLSGICPSQHSNSFKMDQLFTVLSFTHFRLNFSPFFSLTIILLGKRSGTR